MREGAARMKLNRSLKSLIIVSVIFLLILGAVSVLKNIFLQQIKKQIQPNFNYTQIHMKIFPPSLVIEDVRSVSTSPFFSAARISVFISFRSLFSREKPFHVIVERPVMRIYSALSDQEAQESTAFQFRLPFSIEGGWIREGELYYWGGGDSPAGHGDQRRLSSEKGRIQPPCEI